MNRDGYERTGGQAWRRPLVFLGFAAIAAYFLIGEHRVHALSILPWALILLVCPLMHMFMHGGHGGHGGHRDHEAGDAGSPNRTGIGASDPGTHRH